MSAQDASIEMVVIGRNGRSRLVVDELVALRHRVATSRSGSATAQLEAERWRDTVGASLLLIDEIDRPRVRRGR